MDTKPNVVHATIQTVTHPAPQQGAPRGNDGSIDYAPAATEKQLATYRLEMELDRQARNRNAKPAPLRAPGGAA